MNVAPQPVPQDEANDPASVAAAWVERLTAGEPTAAELKELRSWLAADPAHVKAYDRARLIWSSLPETPLRRRRPPLRLVGGTALAAALTLLLLWPAHHDFATPTGAVERLTLPDGTVAWLDSDSAIDLAYDGTHRTVRLARGRAAFDVVRDRDRAFAVEAGDARISDVGTLFAVDRAIGFDVAVERGAVEVERFGHRTRLNAGEEVNFDVQEPQVSKLAPKTMGWRERRLEFENERLDAVLADLGRYYSGRIILADSALGDRRVSGTLYTDRLDEGLDTIARSERLTIHRLPWLILVSSAD